MAITSTDIGVYLSGVTDSTNTLTTNSRGGVLATKVPDQVWETSPKIKNTMHRDITSSEADNGTYIYGCFYIRNDHPTLTLRNLKILFTRLTPANDRVKLWYSGNLPNTQEQVVADIKTKPPQSAFFFPNNDETALGLPNLLAGQWIGIWIELEVPNNTGSWRDNGWEWQIYGTSDP